MPDGHDARACALVLCSHGASPDPLNFYSTTSSSTHRDLLKVFSTKLNRNVPASALLGGIGSTAQSSQPGVVASSAGTAIRGVNTASASHPRRPIQKQQTGFTKNSLSFVEYDPKVDETDYRFLKEAFKTTQGIAFASPAKPNSDAFAKSEFVAQEIIDSGFTRLPKYRVTDQGKRYPLGQSEMKSMFVESSHTLRSPSINKSKLISSTSAFTSDTGHIMSFGTEAKPPSVKPRPVPPKSPNNMPVSEFPIHMNSNGFTRSVGGRILESVVNPPGVLPQRTLDATRRSDPTHWIMMHDNGKSTSNHVHTDLHPMDETMALRSKNISIGPKQDAGSVRNNRAFALDQESVSGKRFTTETQNRFSRPSDSFQVEKFTCDSLSRSGFTSSNKFDYTFPIKNHAEFIASLHPTVAACRQRQDAHVLGAKPTSNPRSAR